MSGKRLTEEQRIKIESLKKEWINEVNEIPEDNGKGMFFQHEKANGPYLKLQKKYQEKISKIMNE